MGVGLELYGRRQDGGEFPADVMLSPLKTIQGNLVIAIVRDITERKRTEKTLRESEIRFRSLFEGIPVGLYRSSTTGQLLDVNPAMVQMLGYPDRETLLATSASALYLDPREREAWQEPLEREGVLAHYENRLRCYDGRVIWVRGTSRVLRDDEGRVLFYEGSLEDITEHKRAEEQIDRQLETLTALYAGAQRLSQSLDLHQLTESVTRAYVEAFGVRLAWLARAGPDGSLRVVTHFPKEVELPRGVSTRWDESPVGQGLAGRALRSGVPEIVHDVAIGHGVPSEHTAILMGEGFRSVAALPLISRDRPFGLLALYSDRSEFFTPERVEFFQAYANLAGAALENARLFEEASRRLEQLQALRNIDAAISGSLDVRVTLNIFLDKVTTLLRADAAAVLLLNPHTQTLEYTAGRGFRTIVLQHTRLRLGQGYAGRATLERRAVHIPDLKAAPGELERSPLLSEEGFVAYHAVPLIAKGQARGVLEVFHRAPLAPDPEWLDFLEALAGQAAVAIDNATLFDDLQRSNVDLTLAYDTTLEGWSRAMDLRDRETEGHTQRVAELTLRLARVMGMSEEDLVHVRRGALLHDIGKMGIPDPILLKPGPLTDEEWVIMRRHPAFAHDLLSPIAYLRPALDIPYCHHEKWDGTGYPRGLKGEQIPLAARIFAVVDVWDALCSDRPYRPAWSAEQARAYIQEQAGKHFDPRVVEVFLALEP